MSAKEEAYLNLSNVSYYIEEKKVDINTYLNGETLLHRAAFDCASGLLEAEVVKYLISKGADINSRSCDGRTPLHMAVKYGGNLEVVEYLISYGADINARNAGGVTPFHIAVSHKGAIEVVKYLVSKGANVNAKDNDGATPLMWARGNYSDKDEEVIQYLANITSKGCYIATAVYNSYDAPEVLSLRRFRDEILSTSILGRLFIKLYYFFSPPVAKRLKKTPHINMFIRKILDKIVEKVN